MGKKAVRVRDEKTLEEKKRIEEESKKLKETKKEPKKELLKKVEVRRGIVRVAETDLDGTKKVKNAILKIKGIGKSLCSAVTKTAGIDADALLGNLSEQEVERLETAMRNPGKFGIPVHMLNRRFDRFSGESKHLVASDLSLAVRADIDFMKKIKCYKGVRHSLGQPVRGQRTRSSFRTGMIVGVARRAAAPAKPGAPAPSKEKAAGIPEKAPAPAAKAAPAPAAKTAAKPEAAKQEKKEEKK